MKKEEIQKKQKDILLITSIIVALVSVLFFAVSNLSSDKIYGNISVAGVDVSFTNRVEAREIIKKEIAAYEGLVFGEKKISLQEIGIYHDIETTLDNIFLVGRNPNILVGIKERLTLVFLKKDLPIAINTNDKLNAFLVKSSNRVNKPVGKSVVAWENGLKYIPGNSGQRLMLAETKKEILKNASILGVDNVLRIKTIEPDIFLSKKEVKILQNKFKEPLLLRYKENVWTVSPQEIIGWIKLEKKVDKPKNYELWPSREKLVRISVNIQEVGYYISSFSSQINVAMKNAVLKIENGRAVAFSLSRNGLELDQADTINKIVEAINSSNREIELKVIVHEAEINEDNLDKLGLKEQIGIGYSIFDGSPRNRIHNIRIGASKFNGVIIKPGEEFSFNKILGPVNASTGYLPELVILRHKTVPQYGGGLCQVSSTAFRTALNSGLPILERVNHAYPVRYYAPYGTDATIYLPKPDFRFKNDTSAHILIQTIITGSTLKFEFYGTKTGKEVKFSGNSNGEGAVGNVESVIPYIYDRDHRGPGSFKSVWYRFIYENGNLIRTDKFHSNYDSPDKYPKPEDQNQ